MDNVLISKFPSGGSWWRVQHVDAGKWQQSFYIGEPTRTPEDNSGNGNANANTNTYTKHNNTRVEKVRKDESQKERERTKMKNVCEYIMDAIDPCASLYTPMQRMDALQWLKQRLFNFVSSDAHLYLGPKRSRTLSMWLSGNSCKPDSEPIVREFVNMLLGDHSQSQSLSLFLDRRGNWLVQNVQ